MAISNGVDKIKIFFKEVWTEGKKTDWPNRQETLRYTIIVITISVVVALFLGVLDFVFLNILERFII